MATRDSKAWKISTTMEPNFEGGLIHNDWIRATMFIKLTKAQRNAIPKLSRSLGGDHTTLCYVRNEGIYELINDPAGNTTTDSDWQLMPTASAGGTVIPIGNWDIANVPYLQDSMAAGANGQFYYVTGAPNLIDVTIPGLFLGQTTQLINEDWVMSVGSHYIRVRNATSWETLNKPQSIIDYENGIVIAHLHEIGDINGLVAELAAKWDESNLADMVLDFAEVPDAGIPNVAFLRKHFYDKTQLYSKVEVDALLSLLSLGDPTFDGNRTIRKLPVVGENVGTDALGETIEEMFYGFVKPVDLLQALPVAEVGSSATPQLIGYVDPKDAYAISGNIVIRDEDNNIAGTVVPASAPAITNFNQAALAKTIEAGTAQSYKVTYNYKKLAGDPDTAVNGPIMYMNGIYPFLFGMSALDLTGANLYSTLTKSVVAKGSHQFVFAGTNQKAYIAFPESYGLPYSIKDQTGNELLATFFDAPVVMAVSSSGLAANWTGINYYVYKSKYPITFTDVEIDIYFAASQGDINTLDDIAEGVTNKHFDVNRRDKLDAITMNPADMGDMKKSVFVTLYPDEPILDHANEIVAVGWNQSGAPIPAGSYVKITGWNNTENLGTFEVADKNNNDIVNAFVEETIPNNAKGLAIIEGSNRNIDTSAHVIGTRVYLGESGGVEFTAPSSGSVIWVGTVIKQANPGLISSRQYVNLLSGEIVSDFRANTPYPQHAIIVYTDPIAGKILLRSKIAFVSSVSLDYANWDIVGADMRRTDYDTQQRGFVDFTESLTVVIHNNTGATLLKGTVVKFIGWDSGSGKPTVSKSNQATGVTANAIVIANILNNETGKVILNGRLTGLNTVALSINDVLYVGDNGAYTITRPTSNFVQRIGYVQRVDGVNGVIVVDFDLSSIDTSNQITDVFNITGGTVTETLLGSTLLIELVQDVTYTLPLISSLARKDYLLEIKNISGATITLVTSGADTLEGNSSVDMLTGESFTLYIKTGTYKIL